MVKDYSPFTPGVPVPLELFTGRVAEVQRILYSINKSRKMKVVERVFVQGERGIGKSSFCSYVKAIAERDQDLMALHVFLGGVKTLEELVRRIYERLVYASHNTAWFPKVKEFFGKHITEADLFGVKVEFSASQPELEKAVSDFTPALIRLMKVIEKEKGGLLLILDDLNGLASEPKFAEWLKSVVDELATSSEAIPVTLILSGLPERRLQLIQTQPSLDRVFDIIEINRFTEKETKEFYVQSFSTVNTTIVEDALDMLWAFSGGFPVFMHEIGDAVFKIDQDSIISEDDAGVGVFASIEIIGKKYIQPNVFEAIRSPRYKKILKHIANENTPEQIRRKDAAASLPKDEAGVLDNFLKKMVDLGVLRRVKDEAAGIYEFTSQMYEWYFRLESSGEFDKK